MKEKLEIINSIKNGNCIIKTDVTGVGLTAEPLDQLMHLCDETNPDTWIYEIGFYVAEPSWKDSGAYVDITVNVCGHVFEARAFGSVDEYLEWTTSSDINIDEDLRDALNAKAYAPVDFSEWFDEAFPTKESLLDELNALEDIAPKEYLTDGWTLCFRKKSDAPLPEGWKSVPEGNLCDKLKKHI